jgi:protein O-GlcNAc transferase
LVTVSGPAFHSRVAASALSAIRLPELIAKDLEEYEDLALNLAQNPDELLHLRRKLAHNKLRSPLSDTAGFTRNIEDAYRTMATMFREGREPSGFKVPADNTTGSLT